MTEMPGYAAVSGDDLFWRPSNQMRVDNADLAQQVGATTMGARFWRLAPGQASTLHRHMATHELYVVIEGTGRIRIGNAEPLTLPRHSVVHVEPNTLRQIFNDTAEDALWLACGAPSEPANTLAMSVETIALLYPGGPKALPPEIDAQGPPASER